MRLLGSLYFIRQIDGNVKALAPLAHALAAGCGLLRIYLRVIHLCIFLSCTSQNAFPLLSFLDINFLDFSSFLSRSTFIHFLNFYLQISFTYKSILLDVQIFLYPVLSFSCRFPFSPFS